MTTGYQEKRIRVNIVGTRKPLMGWNSPEDIAESIKHLLYTNKVLRIDAISPDKPITATVYVPRKKEPPKPLVPLGDIFKE